MKKGIKGYFYTGLITLLPITITLYIFYWIVSFIAKIISKSFIAIFLQKLVSRFPELVGDSVYQESAVRWGINIVSVLIIVLIITLVGYTFKNIFFIGIGKKIEDLLIKAPIIKHIYTTISQIVKIVSTNQKHTYQKVVLIEYPKSGVYSVGFLTAESNIILEEVLKIEKMYNIFIPTSPNPTSGMFVCIAKENVKILDMKIDDAVKLIISGGVIVPKTTKEGRNEESNF